MVPMWSARDRSSDQNGLSPHRGFGVRGTRAGKGVRCRPQGWLDHIMPPGCRERVLDIISCMNTTNSGHRGTVIGIDAHKRTHTMVAVDAGGKRLGEKTVDTTSEGHLAALSWAHAEFGSDLTWAVEDSRAMTHRLERDLIHANQTVIRVPPHLMARHRRSGRVFGKSDPIDALATARAALREPGLPVARHHPGSRHMKLLVDRRDDLVQYRTAVIQRLLWRIHELDPAYQLKPGQLKWTPAHEILSGWLGCQSGLVAELAREELAEIVRVTPVIRKLEKRIRLRVREVAPALFVGPKGRRRSRTES